MCGYQHQVTAEHWDLSTAQLVKQCAEDRKHIISLLKNQKEETHIALECAEQQLETLKKDVEML